MKTFKDFILTFKSSGALNRFVDLVLKSQSVGYKYLEQKDNGDREYRYYNIYSLPSDTISSRIIIATNQIARTFAIVNIVPYQTDIHQLNYDEYNNILDKYYQKVLSKFIKNNLDIIDFEYTKGEYSIEEKIPKSYCQLKQFTELCNMNSPLTHPNDLNRWYKFICSVVIHSESCSSEVIERWLIEEAHFDIEKAEMLADSFVDGRDLLIYYKEHYEH